MFMFSFYLSGMSALYGEKILMSIINYHHNGKLSLNIIGISEKKHLTFMIK